MGDSTNSFSKLERNECVKDGANSSALVGDTLVCKASSDIARKQSSTSDAACFLPDEKQLLAGMNAGPENSCAAPKHEKRGAVDVTVDDTGSVIEVKSPYNDSTFTKQADGSWTQHHDHPLFKGEKDEKVDNVKVDCDGKLTFDYNDDSRNVHVHYEFNADKSWAYTNEFGRFVEDPQGRLIEAPSGEGHSRKFHYDENGKLDQIDGNLGHWDRAEENGKTVWKNRDSGAVWQGDFNVDSISNLLEYRGRDGSAYDFTAWGTDIKRPSFALTKEEESQIEILPIDTPTAAASK